MTHKVGQQDIHDVIVDRDVVHTTIVFINIDDLQTYCPPEQTETEEEWTVQTHSRIRWGRVWIAAVMSEVVVLAVIGIIIAAYRFLLAPGRSDADYLAFGNLAGSYVAPPAAGIAVFFGALWATRRLAGGFIANGALVGVSAVVLTAGFLFAAKPEDRLLYVVSFVLRIAGGWMGGWVAQRSSVRRAAVAVPA